MFFLQKTSAKVFKSKVEASYYADKFNGKKTASGAIFSNSKLTAAHRTLAFGTKVKVTNTANNKSVEVEINDRGPFKKLEKSICLKSVYANHRKQKQRRSNRQHRNSELVYHFVNGLLLK